jgi:Xaa-Pro aminopeptidase
MRFLIPRGAAALLSTLIVASSLRAQETAPPRGVPDGAVRYDSDLLSPAVHRSRRDSLLAVLQDSTFAAVFSAPERTRENDVSYEYRQSSDLYYLTGTREPNSVLLLAPAGIQIDGDTVRELLLVPERDPDAEHWTGRRLGAARAAAQLGLDKAATNDRFEEISSRLLRQGRRLYHLPLPRGVPKGSTLDRQLDVLRSQASILDWGGNRMAGFVASRLLATDSERALQQNRAMLQRLGAERFAGTAIEEMVTAYLEAESFEAWLKWKDERIDSRYADGRTLRARLDALRMVKAEEELILIRRAVDITAAAHREAMKSIEPGMYEYEAEAVIEYVFRKNGAESPGFPSIVGSGENSVILHYDSNRRQMRDGDVVVVDIGAEYRGYTADVTRTVPVNGVFSPEQRAIYQIVLRAQEAGIAAVRAGQPFAAPHRAARAVIVEGLKDLGLIENARDVGRFFTHGTSHYIGLYVHDVGTGGLLVPGTVITVEPGIYIRPAVDIDRKWWNIGVRIEDDVLVTDEDPVVLSAGAPRAIEAVEALMRERGLGNEPAGAVPRPGIK